MRSVFVFLTHVALSVICANSSTGVDLSVLTTQSDWETEKKLQSDFSFSVNHILYFNATINADGLKSILTAWDSGIRDISLYMYPCIKTSVYASSNNIDCGVAQDQLKRIFSSLNSNNVQYVNHSTSHHIYPSFVPTNSPTLNPTKHPTWEPSVSPSIQPTQLPTHPSTEPTVWPTKHGLNSSSPTATPSVCVTSRPTIVPTKTPTREPSSRPVTLSPTPSLRNTTIQRIFVNVEDETPNRYFSGDARVNIQFLADLANEALLHGVQLGVYTTRKDWFNVMTTSIMQQVVSVDSSTGLSTTTRTRSYLYPLSNGTMTTVNPFSSMPLWLPRYDSIASLDFFEPFADWTDVFMKQTSGGAASLRRIGTSRICTDFKELSSQRYDNSILSFISV